MLVAQSCPTLCDPMDCRLPGSSVHGILQARVLAGLPFPSLRDLHLRQLSGKIKTGLLHVSVHRTRMLGLENPGRLFSKVFLFLVGISVCFSFLTQGNHDGVLTHLEPDILECEVKWALGSMTVNKASGGDRIPVELFQILKDDV